MSTLFLIPAAIMGGFGVLALTASTLYWYESINAPEPRIPAPVRTPLSVVRHYCNTLLSYLLCASLTPFGPLLRRPPKPASPNAKAAILIHGLYNNAAAWLYLARVLERAGYEVSTYTYSSYGPQPEEIVSGLDRHIRQVTDNSPDCRPLLLGHSLGGLLARRWLQTPENAGRITALITLGTPHRGSKVAALGSGPLARHLLPGSDFLRTLQADTASDAPLCLSLVSTEDDAVLPAACLLPPPGWRLQLTAPVPHFAMLYSRRVAAQILQELTNLNKA